MESNAEITAACALCHIEPAQLAAAREEGLTLILIDQEGNKYRLRRAVIKHDDAGKTIEMEPMRVMHAPAPKEEPRKGRKA